MKVKLVLLVCVLFSGPIFADQYTGVISYPDAISLTTPTTGIISKTVTAGYFFSKDSQLVKFDTTILQSQILVLNTELKLQQKVYAEAQREFQRSQELYEGTMLSDHELKMSEIFWVKEKKQLEEIKSKLVKRSWERQYSSISAPFNGFVVGLRAFTNQFVSNQLKATPLVTFVNSKNIMLKVLLIRSQVKPDSKLMKLEEGDEVKIQSLFSKNLTYSAKIIALIDRGEQKNKILMLSLTTSGLPLKDQANQLPLNASMVKVIIN
jgi:hypothetical protein